MAVPPIVRGLALGDFELPPFRMVEQLLEIPPAIDTTTRLGKEWRRLREAVRLTPGDEIAIAVGSRGIDRLSEIVGGVIGRLREAGCRPFVVPAMGSHGGACAEGQLAVLASRGITEEGVGAPIRASMEVVQVGEADGVPLFVDRLAQAAPGIVLINRIKPHTDFAGPAGSGLLKMLCIGLGNQVGAELYHGAALVQDLGELVTHCGHQLLSALPVIFGVAVIENQEHRICDLRLIPARQIEVVETLLQAEARTLLPGLPLDDIDLLIVDEMGKDISGAGLDPNVVGRAIGSWSVRRAAPRIARIFVRALTAASHGNACGLGFVDVATPRLIEDIDIEATAINAVTSCVPEDARLPLTLPTERDAIAAALATIRPHSLEDLRIVQITNTSEVTRLLVSQGCLPALEGNRAIRIGARSVSLEFDSQGNLLSPLL